MKRLVSVTLLALFAFGSCLQAAVETKSSPAPTATKVAKPSVAGTYAGKWKGPEDSGGELRVTLKADGNASWTAEAMFTYDGAEIATKMKTVEVDGTKVRLIFTWQIQETPGQSAMSGELSGDTLQGTYETTGAAGASKGTWKLSRT
jgi:hypothetical protein